MTPIWVYTSWRVCGVATVYIGPGWNPPKCYPFCPSSLSLSLAYILISSHLHLIHPSVYLSMMVDCVGEALRTISRLLWWVDRCNGSFICLVFLPGTILFFFFFFRRCCCCCCGCCLPLLLLLPSHLSSLLLTLLSFSASFHFVVRWDLALPRRQANRQTTAATTTTTTTVLAV